jgi:type I restriction enzyme S subunit
MLENDISGTNGIPEGWALTALDNLGVWSTGGTPSRKNSSYFGGGIPWVKSGDLVDGLVTSTAETLSVEGVEKSAAKLLPEGTLSVALYGATIGKLGVLGIDAATNQACANCTVDQRVARTWFVLYFLLQQRQQLIKAGQGGAQPNLTNQIVREWPIPLPPLAEQQRIVAKVEALLARVNAVRQRLAKVAAILKRFRQSVLAAGCSGRLTADWREEHQETESAAELLQRVALNRASRDGTNSREPLDDEAEYPATWAHTTLGYLAEPSLRGRPFVTSGSRGWADLVASTGPYFIRSENINTEYLRLEDAVRVDAPLGPESARTRVRPGDLLLTITGNNVGRTAVVPEGCPAAHVSQHVAIIRLTTLVSPQFLWLWLRSERHGQGQLRAHFYGYTKPGLNLDQVKGVWIALPPIQEQHEIVRRVEALFRLSDAIEKRVVAATARAEKLTQAILAKAFRGELVPTEAELARREGRDCEPASVLLERIHSQRQVKEPKSAKERTRRRRVKVQPRIANRKR